MALFRSKTMKNLRLELAAAHAACALAPNLPPDHQARIAATARSEIAAAATAAAVAGQANEARALLNQQLGNPPKACPRGTSWSAIVQAGLDSIR